MLSEITPLVLTFNEAPNIRSSLEGLKWAQKVIVLDSYSTDETESIARSYENVLFAQRRFDNFAGQCNFGLQQIQTDWVLSLDADYVMTSQLCDEISQLRSDTELSAYYARFRYCVFGQPLRGTLYPPRPILFRRTKCHYFQDGHAHKLVIDGPSKPLRGYLLHDDHKPLRRWLESQQGYAELEAQKLTSPSHQSHSLADRIRQWIWLAVPLTLLYTLIVKGCVLDGWAGWYYVLQRTYAELLLSLELLDERLRRNSNRPAL